jgi:hypothetical protein
MGSAVVGTGKRVRYLVQVCFRSAHAKTNTRDGSRRHSLFPAESPRFRTGRWRQSCEWERVPWGSILALDGDAGRRHPLLNNDVAIQRQNL